MLEEIVEIKEVNWRYANDMLDHCYKLLRIEHSAGSAQHPIRECDPKEHPNGLTNAGGFYVRQRVTYVLGRTAEVKSYDPFQKENTVTTVLGVEV